MKKKVLITGGSGTVGQAFIKEYYNEYEFYNFSRNEENIGSLKHSFPNVKSFVGDICNLEHLVNVYEKISPDIVIHAAAMKHVDLAEQNPSRAIEININGSLNVIKAGIRAHVPMTVGISTDKACDPDGVYGYTKFMMEKLFKEYHNKKTSFVCTRFANVAGSSGSVIPFWKKLKLNNHPLKLTDPNMNRLMFTKKESAHLIQSAIEISQTFDMNFILSRKMKSVNMMKLAQLISNDIQIVGLRPGEKLNEKLISQKEIQYVFPVKQNGVEYYLIEAEKVPEPILTDEISSLTEEFMNENEMNDLLNS